MPSFAINNFKNVMILTPLLSGKSVHLNRFCFLFIILSTTQNRVQLSFTINQGDFRHFSCFFLTFRQSKCHTTKDSTQNFIIKPLLQKRHYYPLPNCREWSNTVATKKKIGFFRVFQGFLCINFRDFSGVLR